MPDFASGFSAEAKLEPLKGYASAALDPFEQDKEILHMQADRFRGLERGFHDAE